MKYLLRFKPYEAEAIKWDGFNDDEVTEFLGTDEWRVIGEVETQPDFFLYKDADGELCSVSPNHSYARLEYLEKEEDK